MVTRRVTLEIGDKNQLIKPTSHCIYYNLVGLGGFEPPTSPLSGVRSNQLSYRPKLPRTEHLKK